MMSIDPMSPISPIVAEPQIANNRKEEAKARAEWLVEKARRFSPRGEVDFKRGERTAARLAPLLFELYAENSRQTRVYEFVLWDDNQYSDGHPRGDTDIIANHVCQFLLQAEAVRRGLKTNAGWGPVANFFAWLCPQLLGLDIVILVWTNYHGGYMP